MLTPFTSLGLGTIPLPLASRFGLGPVSGYLPDGMAIGPVWHRVGVDVFAPNAKIITAGQGRFEGNVNRAFHAADSLERRRAARIRREPGSARV